MNQPRKNDAARFDRLVDGELNEHERRELLAGLDDEPGGWRRCALAFLEAQCWKDSLPKMVFRAHDDVGAKQAAALPTVGHHSTVAKPRRHWTHHLQTAMAMAACFLVALLIGSMLPRGRISSTVPSGEMGSNQVASAQADGPSKTPKEQIAGTRRVPPREGRASEGPAHDDAWQMVTLAPSDGVGGSAVRVPAVERESVDDAWLRSMPSAMPPEVLQALERTGHQVQQRRELMPVPMKDGRRLMVPVDQVDVQYKGNGAY